MKSIQWLPYLHQEMTIGQSNIHLTIEFLLFFHMIKTTFFATLIQKMLFLYIIRNRIIFQFIFQKINKLFGFFMFFDDKLSKKVKKHHTSYGIELFFNSFSTKSTFFLVFSCFLINNYQKNRKNITIKYSNFLIFPFL